MKMRIAAMSESRVYIQILSGEWQQIHLTYSEFINFMKTFFPTVAEQLGDNVEDYYHYGETPEMITEGEAYIFEREK